MVRWTGYLGKCIATPLQMAWPCFATQTGGGKTAGWRGRADEGVNQVGMGIKQTRKQGARRKGCVSALGGGFHPDSPPLAFATPYSLPTAALPLPGRTPPQLPGCARVLFVTVRQRGLSGSWPPWPAAAVALPGPRAPLAPRRSQAPRVPAAVARGRHEAKENKPGEGVGRVTEPGWHLLPPSLGPPSSTHPRP